MQQHCTYVMLLLSISAVLLIAISSTTNALANASLRTPRQGSCHCITMKADSCSSMHKMHFDLLTSINNILLSEAPGQWSKLGGNDWLRSCLLHEVLQELFRQPKPVHLQQQVCHSSGLNQEKNKKQKSVPLGVFERPWMDCSVPSSLLKSKQKRKGPANEVITTSESIAAVSVQQRNKPR